MLAPLIGHRWDLPASEAIALQHQLARQLVLVSSDVDIDLVAGIDVSILGSLAHAAVVVMRYSDLACIEQHTAQRPVAYPYVPGLLTFREAPVVLDALARLTTFPDILLFDGQGFAHPRRLGLASHLGLLLDRPSIGCAKSRLCGTFDEPSPERGSWSPLKDQDEVVGAVVRTRTGVRPVFVSAGHRMSLEQATSVVLGTCRGFRLPEPARHAHRMSTSWVFSQ
ncbi:MAG: deoxyribonuclease V [Chloroflexi bacterium]|nr:deoxyribonuclease V [Chloroflexota bacterium]